MSNWHPVGDHDDEFVNIDSFQGLCVALDDDGRFFIEATKSSAHALRLGYYATHAEAVAALRELVGAS